MNLDDRVARIERQNKWLKRITSSAGLCLLLVLVMAAEPKRTNDQWQLTDEHGTVRIDLAVLARFGPRIILNDIQGNKRLEIGSDLNNNGDPYIHFYNKQGKQTKAIQ